ncbi:hypothetical protein PIROE2DRAFT_17252 [Piromyces sp. E2]|nr:hypothetical protein PIROE2DRAFT_17252 [Piromyces sp. E2]|eukprot:OUM57678.1 hypothetical protein PIROE2DRAFT_17252 [Piromyces sp. E2]
MNTKNIMTYIFIYIILYIQSIYSLDLTVNTTDIPGYLIHKYDKDKIVNRKGLRAFHGRNYYCRNDNCISFENGNGHPPLIEFPDENGNIKRYILETCGYEEPETFWYCSYRYKYNDTSSYRIKCYNDSDCFYNKCISQRCVYNGDSSVTHCDTIYKYFSIFEYSYIHCGKDYEEPCNKNSECSSNECGGTDIDICSLSVKEPSDSDENQFEKIEK